MKNKNGIKNAIVPALLLQLCSGTCYCFSIYRTEISEILSCSDGMTGWLFTAVIFFLGLFAAFSGKHVEKNVYRSSLLASVLLPVGMFIITASLLLKNYIIAMIGFCVMGAGVGLSYICPVKTLALWYQNNKGLATSISIASFGLSKTLFSPIMLWLQKTIGTIEMFFVLGIIFFIIMYIGHLLLAKPDNWIEIASQNGIKTKQIVINKTFWILFIMFLISISNGLCLIGYEKQLLIEYEINAIGLICAVTAIFNCLGRIGFSFLADKTQNKFDCYMIMATINGILTVFMFFKILNNYVTNNEIIILLCVINATYGGFFASLVPILAEEFDLKYLSTVHSYELVAWSLGAISSTFLLQCFTDFTYLIGFMSIFYLISIIIGMLHINSKKEIIKEVI